ncbi:peptide chain release factor 2 [Elusimicrobiota bacterium]
MIKELKEKVNALRGLFEVDQKKRDITKLEGEISKTDFWNNQNSAKAVMSKLNRLKTSVRHWEKLNTDLGDCEALQQLAEEEHDEGAKKDTDEAIKKIYTEIQQLEVETKLSGEYDINNAILSIHAGAGGTESCDWADMLLRMYNRWAEKKGFRVEIVDYLAGDEAGVKSVTFIVKGEYAFGYLQAELGVHRLVRISPFDSNKRRHTSFCSVDVLPEIDDDFDIKVEEKDLRIDTYRASGAGGQHVNTTDSAVRITHTPSGIVVQSQSERSQIKNRATAMRVLKSKLHEIEQEKKRRSVEKHYDEKGDIAWGSQIRSYTFMPYQLVKDHRTGHEVPQVDLVMDGEIDSLISAYLTWKVEKSIKNE